MQLTKLHQWHVQNGARMVDFGGWLMPLTYADQTVKASVAHTRTSCSVFDVSHMKIIE